MKRRIMAAVCATVGCLAVTGDVAGADVTACYSVHGTVHVQSVVERTATINAEDCHVVDVPDAPPVEAP